jgi:hypothetical protein
MSDDEEHIRRQLARNRKERAKLEEARRLTDEIARYNERGELIPDDLRVRLQAFAARTGDQGLIDQAFRGPSSQ